MEHALREAQQELFLGRMLASGHGQSAEARAIAGHVLANRSIIPERGPPRF
jgi:hypothetical protein